MKKQMLIFIFAVPVLGNMIVQMLLFFKNPVVLELDSYVWSYNALSLKIYLSLVCLHLMYIIAFKMCINYNIIQLNRLLLFLFNYYVFFLLFYSVYMYMLYPWLSMMVIFMNLCLYFLDFNKLYMNCSLWKR